MDKQIGIRKESTRTNRYRTKRKRKQQAKETKKLLDKKDLDFSTN